MRQALALAREAAAAGEVPVGAVVVRDGVVIGQGRNHPIAASDPCAHAEVAALREAAAARGNYRLDDCDLYVSLEPCAMCSGAILHARIRRLVFGAADPRTGCAGSVLNLFEQPLLNHQTSVQSGLLAEESGKLLQDFFQQRRSAQRAAAEPLREDALRPAGERFAGLADPGWSSRYLNLASPWPGGRMHYLDEQPAGAARTCVLLHRLPGWSWMEQAGINHALAQGYRVIAPDLLGYGKSDQPKREAVHTLAFHRDGVLALLAELGVEQAELWVPPSAWRLGEALAAGRDGLRLVPLEPAPAMPDGDTQKALLEAPYPNAGHRAALRALPLWAG